MLRSVVIAQTFSTRPDSHWRLGAPWGGKLGSPMATERKPLGSMPEGCCVLLPSPQSSSLSALLHSTTGFQIVCHVVSPLISWLVLESIYQFICQSIRSLVHPLVNQPIIDHLLVDWFSPLCSFSYLQTLCFTCCFIPEDLVSHGWSFAAHLVFKPRI